MEPRLPYDNLKWSVPSSATFASLASTYMDDSKMPKASLDLSKYAGTVSRLIIDGFHYPFTLRAGDKRTDRSDASFIPLRILFLSLFSFSF